MSAPAAKHPLAKLIAMIVAVLLLWIQFAAAFHHHHSQVNAKQGTSLGTTLTAKFTAECAICHYMAHQAHSELGRIFSWLVLAGILLMIIAAPAQCQVSRGFRFTTLNKGPPTVSFL